jgi:hypothetical protein
MALPWLRQQAYSAAVALSETTADDVMAAVRPIGELIADENGELRPTALAVLLGAFVLALIVVSGGIPWPSSVADTPPPKEEEPVPLKPPVDDSQPKPDHKPHSKSIKELEAMRRRALKAARDWSPDSPLFWRSFKSSRRGVSAFAASPSCGNTGPQMLAVAEDDLTVRICELASDGSGAVAKTHMTSLPASCGPATALAFVHTSVRTPSMDPSKSGKIKSFKGAPTGFLVGIAGHTNRLVVWSLAAIGDCPTSLIDLALLHPHGVSRIVGFSSLVAVYAADNSNDTSISFFTPASLPRIDSADIRSVGFKPSATVAPVAKVSVAQGKNFDLAVSPGRQWVAASTHMSEVRLWEVGTSRVVKRLTLSGVASGSMAGVVFVPPGVAPVVVKAGSRHALALAHPPAASIGDSPRVVTVSTVGVWEVWDIDVNLTVGERPKSLASGSIAVSAGETIRAVRRLHGTPLRLLCVLEKDRIQSMAVVVLVSGGEEEGTDLVRFAGVASPRGDALELHRVELDKLEGMSSIETSDGVCDTSAEACAMAGIGSAAHRGLESFVTGEVAAASNWATFAFTSHGSSPPAIFGWRFPPVVEGVERS